MIRRRAATMLMSGLLALAAFPAMAGDRILVSAKSGADAPGCGTPAAPCRSFQFAHNAAPAGGEIEVMDPGDYGPVLITKALSIVNDGAGAAGVLAVPATGAGVEITAGASDRIVLRGLTIISDGTADYGVRLNVAGSITITKCFVHRFQAHGVHLAPTSPLNFAISDSVFTGNAIAGVRVEPFSGVAATGVIERVSSTGNRGGIEVMSDTTVTIAKSVASNNAEWGVNATGGFVSARDVVASNNGSESNPNSGGFVSAGGLIRVAHSLASGNNYAVVVNGGGTIESYADNNLRGNMTGVSNLISGTFTAVPNR